MTGANNCVYIRLSSYTECRVPETLLYLVDIFASEVASEDKGESTDTNGCINGQLGLQTGETITPVVKVVPPGAKTTSVTKGFDILAEKLQSELKFPASPRSQSPASGRVSPSVDLEDKRKTSARSV
ncbi:unnamed protein product, partial [Timema podura]|nr:unnamed protein product [Timema podura]